MPLYLHLQSTRTEQMCTNTRYSSSAPPENPENPTFGLSKPNYQHQTAPGTRHARTYTRIKIRIRECGKVKVRVDVTVDCRIKHQHWSPIHSHPHGTSWLMLIRRVYLPRSQFPVE
ncbi:uncharacterized protein LOC141526466 [Cotesia typhae]|uniref:uncharacterized protein LOC141526466 n=1 Tax=Cotesia typhae TaxID=2053667 RepID=UPI003D688F2F